MTIPALYLDLASVCTLFFLIFQSFSPIEIKDIYEAKLRNPRIHQTVQLFLQHHGVRQ